MFHQIYPYGERPDWRSKAIVPLLTCSGKHFCSFPSHPFTYMTSSYWLKSARLRSSLFANPDIDIGHFRSLHHCIAPWNNSGKQAGGGPAHIKLSMLSWDDSPMFMHAGMPRVFPLGKVAMPFSAWFFQVAHWTHLRTSNALVWRGMQDTYVSSHKRVSSSGLHVDRP